MDLATSSVSNEVINKYTLLLIAFEITLIGYLMDFQFQNSKEAGRLNVQSIPLKLRESKFERN
jgi:hypothetical protein